MKKDDFFARRKSEDLELTYDDVLLKTDYSEVMPDEVMLQSRFSRHVPLNIPIVSSPMDTVTGAETAIALAMAGGLGIIHRSLSAEMQKREMLRVKYRINRLIRNPIAVDTEMTLQEIINMVVAHNYDFRSFPVVDHERQVVGLINADNFDFCDNLSSTAKQEMTKDNYCVAENNITIEQAYDIMKKEKKKKLILVDSEGRLYGMYVFSDARREATKSQPSFNVDINGNLRVGIAVGVGDEALKRAELMVPHGVDVGVDVIVIDTAHGDSKPVYETLKELKRTYPNLDIVVGNVSEGESAKRLAEAGADGIKIGQGPGSICTTRKIAGVGCPQVTAVYNCALAVRGTDVPICADGGIEYSGDITVALAAEASSVMLGRLLAGTDEAPVDIEIIDGLPFKLYRGMGSIGAMRDSKAAAERYGQANREKRKLVAEGIEGYEPYKGPVDEVIRQLLGGLRSGMGYLGAKNIQELSERARFHMNTRAGSKESHPHGMRIMRSAPNYLR